MNFEIAPARAADLDAAADTLRYAFADYPWTRWSIPAEGYPDRLRELQRLYLEYALAQGVVLTAHTGVRSVIGVIAVLAPGAADPPAAMYQRVAELHGDRLAVLADAQVPALPADAWNLATLGVHPDAQGNGVGGHLIAAALAGVQEISPPARVGLETSDERNVALYQRAGFARAATTLIPDGPTVYSMLREPAG